MEKCCKRGHVLTAENTYIWAKRPNYVYCKMCHRDTARNWYNGLKTTRVRLLADEQTRTIIRKHRSVRHIRAAIDAQRKALLEYRHVL